MAFSHNHFYVYDINCSDLISDFIFFLVNLSKDLSILLVLSTLVLLALIFFSILLSLLTSSLDPLSSEFGFSSFLVP